jgi:hypothetical protein
MGCNCGSRNRARAAGAGKVAPPAGTYRVMVGTRQVYESANESSATQVAARFADARVLAPGVQA